MEGFVRETEEERVTVVQVGSDEAVDSHCDIERCGF